jgi:hypothetical protein
MEQSHVLVQALGANTEVDFLSESAYTENTQEAIQLCEWFVYKGIVARMVD